MSVCCPSAVLRSRQRARFVPAGIDPSVRVRARLLGVGRPEPVFQVAHKKTEKVYRHQVEIRTEQNKWNWKLPSGVGPEVGKDAAEGIEF